MDRRKILALAATYSLYIAKRKRKHICWHKKWLGDYQRLTYSFIANLEPVIFSSGDLDVRNYIRVDSEVYFYLLNEITPLIEKQTTSFRTAISPREKLSITLSYLSEGLSYRRLSYEYRVGVSTVGKIIDETINALILKLVPKYLTIPHLEEEWVAISDRFSSEWQYPNCIGALDGKHIHMFPPRNSGSLYYNYKEGFSIVLMALVDADYKFIGVDIGANGRCSDSGIWSLSKLRKKFEKNSVHVPPPKALPNSSTVSPFVIVADSGFELEEFVMRPYGEKNITKKQRVFNYRLSRARRVSENAFGILANRWRILLSRLLASPEKATAIVTICCTLHNLLCSRNETKVLYIPEGFVDKEDSVTGEVQQGLWRKLKLPTLPQQRQRNATHNARIVRDHFKDYFLGPGSIKWQEKYTIG